MIISELDVAFTERLTSVEDSFSCTTPADRFRGGPEAFVRPDDSPEQPQGFYPVQTKSFQGCFGFNCNRCHLSYAIAPARVLHCKKWESRPVLVESKPEPTPVRIPDMQLPSLRQRVKSFVIRWL
jgi:hypothetical protein